MRTQEVNSSLLQKSFKKIKKIVSLFEIVLLYLAGLSLILILGSIVYGVAARTFFNISTLWVNDFAGYLTLYLVFLSAPWILKHGGHVQVDLITSNLKGFHLKVNKIIISVISAVSSSLLCWFSFKVTLNYYQMGTVMMASVSWPKYILVAPITIGSFFLVIRFLLIMLNVLWNDEENNAVKQADTLE